MLAAYLGEEEVLVLLKDHKVNLEGTDFLGRTAVHHAVLGRQKKSLAYLHSFGVNLLALDANNKVPINMLDGCDDSESQSVIGYLSNLCKQKAKTQHALPNFIIDPPENLVFKGNDPTGLAYLGVIKALEMKGKISGIRRVAGPSTGALIATLFAVGYSFEEIASKAKLFSSFFDSPIADQAISAIPIGSPLLATLQRLRDIIQLDSPLGKDQFKSLHQLPSLCSGKTLLDWIKERIYEKTGIHDCTFGELKKLAETNLQFKHLTVFTTCFGSTLIPSRFSSEDMDSNEIVISHAVCAALAIPGIFPLKSLYSKNKAGGVDERPSLGLHGDAGIINAFPVETYDLEKYQSVMPLDEEAGKYFRLNKRTLGFALETQIRNCSIPEKAIVHQFLEVVLNIYCQMDPSMQQSTLYNRFRVVRIQNQLTGELSSIESTERMKRVIDAGEESTVEFFDKHELVASSLSSFLNSPERTNQGIKWTNLKSLLPYFMGRTKQINILKERLIPELANFPITSSSSSTLQPPQQKRSCVVLAGEGGMGKSETAIAFAHQYRESFSVVWWIETATPQSMDRSFRQLAEALEIYIDPTSSSETTRRRIYHYLKTENLGKPYLLIFDNAEESFELPQGNGCVLITTTQPANFSMEGLVPIEPLSQEESICLVSGILQKEANEEMGHLAAELGYLPAILSQAAQYIKTTPGMSLHRYLELLSKEKIKVLNMMPVDSRYSKAQLSTWRMTHETLMHHHPIAYEWLEICAYLQPDVIPSSYLETWLECFKEEQSYVDRTMKKDQILKTLVNSGILRYDEKSDSYSLHRIRQEMIRQLLVGSEVSLFPSSSSSSLSLVHESARSPSKQRAVALMAAIVNHLDLEEKDDWLALAPYEVQLRTVLNTINNVEEESEEMAKISHLLGRWLLIQGKCQEARQHLTKALEIRRRLLPSDHPDTARTLNYMGDALRQLRLTEEAKAHFTEGYKMRKRLYQGDHTEIAASLLNMALFCNRLTEFEKHQKYTNRAIEMWWRLYPNGHHLIALALANKADVFKTVNRLDEAYGFAVEAFQMLEYMYDGNDSKNTQTLSHVLQVLGSLTELQGNKDEALSYYKKAVEIYRKINPSHPKIFTCLIYIGNLLTSAESFVYFAQYLDSNSLSGNDSGIRVALYAVGWGNYKLSQYETALEQLTRSLALSTKAIEGDHTFIAQTLGRIGIVQQKMHKHKEAVANFRLAIEMLKRIEQENNFAEFLPYLGNSLKALGRHQEARKCFAESTAIERIVSIQPALPSPENSGQMPVQNPEGMNIQSAPQVPLVSAQPLPPPAKSGCIIS